VDSELDLGNGRDTNKELLGSNKLNKAVNPYPDPTTTTVVQLVASNKSNKLVNKLLYVLLDSGSSHSMIKGWCAKYGRPKPSKQATFHTAAGAFSSGRSSRVNFILSEFTEKKRITWDFYVDDTPCTTGIKYDMIIGRDLLHSLGLILDFKNQIVHWEDIVIDMHPPTSAIPGVRSR
jgi:hypothetical protein